MNEGLGTNNGLYVKSIAINGNYIAAGTGGGVFFSANNGSSWTAENKAYFGNAPEVFTLVMSGSYIFAGTEAGGVGKCNYEN